MQQAEREAAGLEEEEQEEERGAGSDEEGQSRGAGAWLLGHSRAAVQLKAAACRLAGGMAAVCIFRAYPLLMKRLPLTSHPSEQRRRWRRCLRRPPR